MQAASNAATSRLSLHGLVRHLAEVERIWFRRVLQRELADRLAVLLLDGTVHAGDTVQIGLLNDQLSFH